jgi:hypothetical protein
MYGPPVMPPQPEGVWNVVYSGDREWQPSAGDDSHRRGLYTFIRRTTPYPSMITFDGTSREICTVRRIRTNTPLQALVTLNDPVYVEAAQALGREIAFEGGRSAKRKARYAIARALARPARGDEVDRILDLFNGELEAFQSDPEAAKLLATDPIGPAPEDADVSELAAWTTVANVLLNLDEFVTKR